MGEVDNTSFFILHLPGTLFKTVHIFFLTLRWSQCLIYLINLEEEKSLNSSGFTTLVIASSSRALLVLLLPFSSTQPSDPSAAQLPMMHVWQYPIFFPNTYIRNLPIKCMLSKPSDLKVSLLLYFVILVLNIYHHKHHPENFSPAALCNLGRWEPKPYFQAFGTKSLHF